MAEKYRCPVSKRVIISPGYLCTRRRYDRNPALQTAYTRIEAKPKRELPCTAGVLGGTITSTPRRTFQAYLSISSGGDGLIGATRVVSWARFSKVALACWTKAEIARFLGHECIVLCLCLSSRWVAGVGLEFSI